MKKKAYVFAVIGMVAAFLLAGCGKKEEKKQEAPAQQQTEVYNPEFGFPEPVAAKVEAPKPKPVIKAVKPVSKARAQGRVYGLRGLFGTAAGFSWGVDEAVAKVASLGFRASAVRPHWQWRALAQTIEANWKLYGQQPIVIIGHSMGADAIPNIVEYLRARGIPVALAVFYDPTPLVALVPPNVQRAIGYRNQAFAQLGQGYIHPSEGFTGSIQNRSKIIAHTDLDNDPFVHAATNCEATAVLNKTKPNCPWYGEFIQK